jgi:hypothetical protein
MPRAPGSRSGRLAGPAPKERDYPDVLTRSFVQNLITNWSGWMSHDGYTQRTPTVRTEIAPPNPFANNHLAVTCLKTALPTLIPLPLGHRTRICRFD